MKKMNDYLAISILLIITLLVFYGLMLFKSNHIYINIDNKYIIDHGSYYVYEIQSHQFPFKIFIKSNKLLYTNTTIDVEPRVLGYSPWKIIGYNLE